MSIPPRPTKIPRLFGSRQACMLASTTPWHPPTHIGLVATGCGGWQQPLGALAPGGSAWQWLATFGTYEFRVQCVSIHQMNVLWGILDGRWD